LGGVKKERKIRKKSNGKKKGEGTRILIQPCGPKNKKSEGENGGSTKKNRFHLKEKKKMGEKKQARSRKLQKRAINTAGMGVCNGGRGWLPEREKRKGK